jgi:DDE superfamily endonuclease
VDDFDRQTKVKAAGETRVILLDGHSSHYTPELVDYARENNIIILGYPPHCTHALQGLDVVCFARMKEAWKDAINRFEQLHRTQVTKGNFTKVFGEAFLMAFTRPTILAAFEKTGIYPYNPSVIMERQMEPSKATSTHGSFPLPQPSPVRAVMTAFHHHPITSFDVSPDTHRRIDTDTDTEVTPGPKRRMRDEDIDPSLFTPSKRMRILSTSLATTSSGSFLIQKPPIVSSQVIAPPVIEHPPPLAEPDWALLSTPADKGAGHETLESRIGALTTSLKLSRQHILARDAIIEGAHATMVVQSIYCDRLNETLNTREKKKQTDRNRLLFPDGKGRHVTSDGFRAALAELEKKKADKATEHARKQQARDQKRVAKAAAEELWKETIAAHQQEIQQWESECARLRAQGTLAKNLPKKPKRAAKPKPEVNIDADAESAGSGDEVDDLL